jgi:UDP-glucose 4-epimerase
MKLLVIGGAGYIGAHVVNDLVEERNHVIVYDNLSSGFKENLPENCTFIQGDILNKDELISALNDDIDAVFHFAAKKAAGESMVDVRPFSQTNISGTINILDAMVECEVNNIIFSSTAAVYGEPEYLPMDESHPTIPTNYYGFTKLKIEELLSWYSKIHAINFASLRYFNAVGYDVKNRISIPEKNPQNLFPILMEVLSGDRESMDVYGNDYDTPDGTCIRDYIHVNDLSKAHVNALTYLVEKKESLCLNLGTGNGYSVLEAIKSAELITDKKVKFTISGRRDGDPKSLYAKSNLANELLSWFPEYSSLETIMQSMWRLYKKESENAIH